MSLSKPVILMMRPWRIGVFGPEIRCVDVPLEEPVTIISIAMSVARVLKELRYQGQPLVLALPSRDCLAAAIATQDLPRQKKARRQAMIYRLEEHLPLAAEDFVADFVSSVSLAGTPVTGSSAGNAAGTLGVAVAGRGVLDLVEALEDQGVAIGPICPESFLSLQALAIKLPIDGHLFWAMHGELEVFTIASGSLAGWNLLEMQDEALERYLSIASLHASECLLVNCPDSMKVLAGSAATTTSADQLAVQAAHRVLAGNLAPLIDLRRDALGAKDPFRMVRRPLRAVIASAVLLLICLIGGFSIQAWRYDQETAALEGRQEALFRKLYPGSPIPAGIRARLQSETLRLRAISGQSSDLPQQGSALAAMYEVFRRLPTDVRYRLLDMQFGPQDFTLEGQSKSHGDADVIASALRRQKGFNVEPTRTEQLSSGQVSFTLAGNMKREARP